MPRIISGKYKGLKLVTPPKSDIRPTSDRSKEALFSILGERVRGADILDLFAGSGQIALEAISRGAKTAVLCEINRTTLTALFINIKKTHSQDQVQVFTYDARRVAKKLVKDEEKFDFIYLDPPWRLEDDMISDLEKSLPELLKKDGILIIESNKREETRTSIGGVLKLLRSCTYGATMLSFYCYEKYE